MGETGTNSPESARLSMMVDNLTAELAAAKQERDARRG